MEEIFQEFAEDGTPLLSEKQQERFVELLKKSSVLLRESVALCMKCGSERKASEQIKNAETGELEWPSCDCGLPEPEGPLRFDV